MHEGSRVSEQATSNPPVSSRVIVLEGPCTPLLVSALREQGESVICAATAAEVDTLLAEGPAPDAVVLDLSGPRPARRSAPATPSPRKGSDRPTGRGEHPGDPAGEPNAHATTRGSAGDSNTDPSPRGPARAESAFVLAVTPGGARPAQPPLEVSVCVPAEDAERALRELRGALALRRLSGAMEEVERLRSAVLHARRTAHDLAQPLTTIMARAQLLAGKLKPDDPHARPLGIICEESEKMASLIEQFQKIKVIAAGPGKRAD